MKLSVLAKHLGAELQGDGNIEIHGVSGIDHANSGDVTFIANPKYASQAKTTKASAILVAPNFPEIEIATLRLKNPYLGFAQSIELFYKAPAYPPGIHPTAAIDPTAKIGASAHIGAYAVIGPHVVIGDNATILPHVVIYQGAKIGDSFFAHAQSIVRENCILGNHVTLQNGVIVGADGYGFAKDNEGEWHKILQSGHVHIEDDVEIQANACVDRASVGVTHIARGVKIDNFVQVGHGSSVGEKTLLCSQVGLAGSTVVGKNVILAGQVGVAGHCTIGDGVIATAQSGIPNDVAPGKVVSGYPAVENRQWLRASAIFHRLPEIVKRLERMRKVETEKD